MIDTHKNRFDPIHICISTESKVFKKYLMGASLNLNNNKWPVIFPLIPNVSSVFTVHLHFTKKSLKFKMQRIE